MITADLPAAVAGYLARRRLADPRVVSLSGDASDRRYFRVLAGEARIVLAVHTAPFDAATLPFLNVAGLFAAMPLPVPRILDVEADLGVMALEDLGDLTLQALLGAGAADEQVARYREAIGFIDILQHRGRELADPGTRRTAWPSIATG